jgi:hypothetical protein
MRRASSGKVNRAVCGGLAAGAVAAVCLASVFASVAAGATVTIGPPDVSGHQGSDGCTSTGVVCSVTLAQLTQPTPGVLLTAPADGVITAWHVHGATDFAPSGGALALRVLRRGSDGLFTGVATSAAVQAIDVDGSPSHAVSISVQAGDYIGVDAVVTSGSSGSGADVYFTTPSGAVYSRWSGALPDGSALAASSIADGRRLMLNAVESLRPAISGVSPPSGSTAGGDVVTVTGSNLDGATGVSFGGTPAASFTAVSATQITAPAPAHAPGTVDVQVTGPGGASPATGADNYSYVQPGAGGGPLPPAGGGTELAKVGSERLAPSSFAAAPSGPSAVSAKRKYGTKVTYTLNEAARVRFTVTRAQPGRTASQGRCVALTRRNRSSHKCTLAVTLGGNFTRTGKAATNTFRFTGRIGGKRLKPGSYKLVASPTANGDTGRAVSVRFRIIK